MRGERFWQLEHCSNEALLSQLDRIMSSGRRLTAELVAHLGEVEERRLHLEAACSSMFDYCLRRLGLSEDEAYRRIEVARLARRFPALFPLLASGELSLTLAALLKLHLTAENEAQLIAAVKGKTAARAREVLAALFPRPDAPEVVRKLPARAAPVTPAAPSAPLLEPATASCSPVSTPAVAVPAPTRVPMVAPARPLIEPLSAARYRVQLTVSTRREVLARDGLQCSWVDDHGRRCAARGWIEFDHCKPRGKGGGAEPENIRMLCKAHNRLAAERAYGRAKVAGAIARRRAEVPERASG